MQFNNLFKRMLREVILEVELLKNKYDYNINEYDVQNKLYLFLKSHLRNTDYKVQTEKFGKHDLVILDRQYILEPWMIFELKTFIKPKESVFSKVSYTNIFKDIDKLYKSSLKFENSKVFFVLFCKTSEINISNSTDDFIINFYNNIRKWVSFGNYKLKPYSKDFILDTSAFIWEMKRKAKYYDNTQ